MPNERSRGKAQGADSITLSLSSRITLSQSYRCLPSMSRAEPPVSRWAEHVQEYPRDVVNV